MQVQLHWKYEEVFWKTYSGSPWYYLSTTLPASIIWNWNSWENSLKTNFLVNLGVCYTLCSTLPCLHTFYWFFSGIFSSSNQWSMECFVKIMQRAFRIKYKKVFIFPNKSKLHSRTKKHEAKFRVCFSQVQQVKPVNKKIEDLHAVFIDTHNKLHMGP